MKVNYKYTSNAYQASLWLNELPDTIACDFEVAPIYTENEVDMAKFRLANFSTLSWKKRIEQEKIVMANGLSHVSQTMPTHLSIAYSDNESIVIILNNEHIRQYVCNWLVTTDKKQIWHNCSYDFTHIKKYTGKIPKNFEDTMLWVKCLTNHVETYKARTGLKELEGKIYGAWGLASDNFQLCNMYNEKFLSYAATDSCACYHLYNEIQQCLAST